MRDPSLKQQRNSQAGFSLVEVLVSSGILMVALLGTSSAIVQHAKSRASAMLATQGEQALRTVLSQVQSQPGRFPAMVASSGNQLMYVGCYGQDGVPQVPASAQNSQSSHSATGANFIVLNQDPANLTSSNPLACSAGQGGFEVRILNDSTTVPGQNILKVQAVILDQVAGGGSPGTVNAGSGTPFFKATTTQFGQIVAQAYASPSITTGSPTNPDATVIPAPAP